MASLAYRQLVGLRVRALRDARGAKANDLAYAAGISRSYLGDIEAGRRNVTIEVIGRLAGCLGVSLAGFFADAAFDVVDGSVGRVAGADGGPLPEGAGSVGDLLEMSGSDRAVLVAVRGGDGAGGDRRVTIASIAAETGLGTATVQRALARLSAAGHVRREGSRRDGRWVAVG